MFKSAATKLAHNSTIPALAGNRDIRPLQDLITAEKAVLVSLQKLSADTAKASEVLRTWAIGEGDDLADTLGASATIFAHFSAALTNYATREQTVRDNMKAVRTREEGLDELKRKRRSVMSKADTAEKKLQKMSPEHKNLAAQSDMLNKLRDEIRMMDAEIVAEEASLGDFKRQCAKNWMTLKFGGLVECCEKGTIIGEIGKNILAEIPEEPTQPGFPRPYYGSHSTVGYLVSEAQRFVGRVAFSGQPSPLPNDGWKTSPAGAESPVPYSSQPLSRPNSMAGSHPGGSVMGVSTYFDQDASSMRPSAGTSRRISVDELGYGIGSSSTMSPTSPRFGPGNSGTTFASYPGRRSSRIEGGPRDEFLPQQIDAETSKKGDISFTTAITEALTASDRKFPGPISVAGHTLTESSLEDPAPQYEVFSQSTYTPPAGPPEHNPSFKVALREREDQQEDLEQVQSDDMPSSQTAAHSLEERRSPLEVHDTPGEPEIFAGLSEVKPASEPKPLPEIFEPHPPMGKHDSQESTHTLSGEHRIPRVRPPSADSGDDERARNAATAREISREMDALTFYTPSVQHPPSPPLQIPSIVAPQASEEPTSHNTEEIAAPLAEAIPESPVEIPIPLVAAPVTVGMPLPSLPSSNVPSRAMPVVSPASDTSPYRTPPEYPRYGGASTLPAATKSSPSLASTQVPPGVRTISAAAFRRPQARAPSRSSESGSISGPADTSPLSLRKRGLPISPPTSILTSQPPSRLSIDFSAGAESSDGASTMLRGRQEGRLDLGHEQPASGFEDEEDFDYISAYVNGSQPNSAYEKDSEDHQDQSSGQNRFNTHDVPSNNDR